jgi:hypothetical protein
MKRLKPKLFKEKLKEKIKEEKKMGQDQLNLQSLHALCLSWKVYCEGVVCANVDDATKERWVKDMHARLFEPSNIVVPE